MQRMHYVMHYVMHRVLAKMGWPSLDHVLRISVISMHTLIHMHYMHAFLAPAELAYAFLARVLRTAAPSLAGVLSGTRPASLRSYSKGSYNTYFTVLARCVLIAFIASWAE